MLLCMFGVLLLGTSAAAARKPLAGHVVMIAFDGWGAYSVPKARIPNIRSLMAAGCYTLSKRSVLPSASAINWASMFNGCPTEVHGYTTWNSRRPEIPSRWENNAHHIIPTIFTLMQEQRPALTTVCLYEWDGIKYLIDSLGVGRHAQINGEAGSEPLVRAAEQSIATERPALLCLCFDGIDHVGHAEGHDTPAYYAKLEEYDAYVGRIVSAARKAYGDDVIFLMSSDHGGTGKGHGGKTLVELETPFIIAGRHVRQGGEFNESMMQYDTAATLAYIFGLQQPQVWTGRPMRQVFK